MNTTPKKGYNCYLGTNHLFDWDSIDHLGPMGYEWKHPPEPFNPDYRPNWKAENAAVSAIVEAGEPYASREERKQARAVAYERILSRIKGEENDNNIQ